MFLLADILTNWQTAAVIAITCGAAGYLTLRGVRLFRTSGKSGACGGCPSGCAADGQNRSKPIVVHDLSRQSLGDFPRKA